MGAVVRVPSLTKHALEGWSCFFHTQETRNADDASIRNQSVGILREHKRIGTRCCKIHPPRITMNVDIDDFLDHVFRSIALTAVGGRPISGARDVLIADFPLLYDRIDLAWDELPLELTRRVHNIITDRVDQAREHPLRGSENLTATVAEAILSGAIERVNSGRPGVDWLDLGQHIPARDPTSNIAGYSEYVVFRHDVPICVVELKSRARGPRQVQHGMAQGLVAAAIHSASNQEVGREAPNVAVIVTNLEEWIFAGIGDNFAALSESLYFNFHDMGIGFLGELHTLLGNLVHFFRTLS